MRKALQVCFDEAFDEAEKQQYRAFLSSVSSVSVFEDEKWVCDTRRKSAAEQSAMLSIVFTAISDKYRDMVKYYALRCLIGGNGVRTVKLGVQNVGAYLRFLEGSAIDSADIMTASEYKRVLDDSGVCETTKETMWRSVSKFYSVMNGWSGAILRNPFSVNPFYSDKLHDYKYIPEETARQLDAAFTDDKMPLHLRCIYWLLRLIPSRISEILGMKIECVKPFDGHFCISIPTWKQNGGYTQPLIRVIHVNGGGASGYLLGLLAEQQKRAFIYQEYLPEDKRGYLFSYRQEIELNGKVYDKDRYMLATWTAVSYGLRKICGKYGIVGADGHPYCVTSHQFRHNGITDRLLAGFTTAEIADMTGHHGDGMILASYTHFNLFPERLTEPIEYRKHPEKLKNECILFCGRIINMDAVNEARLLKNLRSHRIPGGICADVTHCKSGMWSCIDCENFVPEKEQLSYFTEQVEEWDKKSKLFGHDAMLTATFKKKAEKFRYIIRKLQDTEETKDE